MPRKDQKILLVVTSGIDTPVVLLRNRGGTYSVEYEKDRTSGLDWSRAAERLGQCIMHSLDCTGRTDEDFDVVEGIGDELCNEVREAICQGKLAMKFVEVQFYENEVGPAGQQLRGHRKPLPEREQLRILKRVT